MNYQNSTVVSPSCYETQGLCDGIPLRIGKCLEAEDRGAVRCCQDWKRLCGFVPVPVSSLGPRYNFLSVAFPEMISDRMETLAYFNEFGLMLDDQVESVEKFMVRTFTQKTEVLLIIQQGDRLNNDAIDVCRNTDLQGLDMFKRGSARHYMLSKVARKMLATDPVAGSTALGMWAEWFEKGAGRENHTAFKTLDEFLQYRVQDVGEK
jgi:hypothetical protein